VENSFRISSPAGWPKRSLMLLKWSMSKIITVTGRPAAASRYDPRAGFRKAAAVQHSAQGIDRGCVLCTVTARSDTSAEDHEHGADRIQHEFDRERRHPDAAGEGLIMGRRGRRAGSAASARRHA
jgi:hypothetical protein